MWTVATLKKKKYVVAYLASEWHKVKQTMIPFGFSLVEYIN